MYVYRTWCKPTPIQVAGARPYDFAEALRSHVSEPGGFALLVAYLCGTWMFNLMPASYYSFEGGVQPVKVLAQLLIQVRFAGRHAVEAGFAVAGGCLGTPSSTTRERPSGLDEPSDVAYACVVPRMCHP